MKWVSYAWSILIGLTTTAIAFAVLLKFSSPFERVVVDLLVLLYVTIDGALIHAILVTVDQAKVAQRRYLETMKRLGSTEHETPGSTEYLAEEQAKIDRNVVKVYIRSGFAAVMFFAALWSLIVDLNA